MEKLFLLVKSLNGMEKRYFRLSVSVHKDAGSRTYMRLFNALLDLPNYDEKILRAKFKGDKILNRFDMAKNYLYRLVLNSLQSYHRHSNSSQTVITLLEQANILHNKTLYKPCISLLNKAEKLAKNHEHHELLLKVLQMKMVIDEKSGARLSHTFHKDYKAALEKLTELNSYRELYHHIYTFFSDQGNDLRNKAIKKQYKDFLAHPLLSKKEPSLYRSQSYYLLSLGLCHFCLDASSRSFDYTRKHLAVISEHPQRIKDDPDTYVTVLNSIIFYGSVLSKVKESQKAFDTLREFLDLYPEKHHKLFVAYDNMMALYITAGRFRDGLPFADKAASELKAHEEKLFASNKVALYHDMFYTYFGCRKYHQSLEWLNKLLNETGLKSREDIQVTARLTNLIVHYELQHYELLPYLLRSTQTFLRKRKRLHTVEKVLLRFMNRLLKVSADDKREMRQLFSEIKSALEIVTRNPDEAKVLTEYFDYVSWLESKIRNRPFEKVVRDKALITKTNFS